MFMSYQESEDGHFYADVLNSARVLSHITWSSYVAAMLHKGTASKCSDRCQTADNESMHILRLAGWFLRLQGLASSQMFSVVT